MSNNSNATDYPKPVIFLAFANPPAGARGHLRNLGEEARQLESVLQQAEQSNLCEVVIKPYAGLSEILEVFRQYRNRIAIFHYAGHAKNFMLLLEDANTNIGTGANRGTALIDGRGLATFLGEQNGLQFVFLNACSTQPQVDALLAVNVSAVVATSQSIRDDIATKLASEFYASLSSGATLQKAFNEAEGVAQAMVGMGHTRDITFDDDEGDADSFDWPWRLMVNAGAEAVADWSLPDAANEPLFGLPTLPEYDLPDTPFRHLNFFEEQDAELFFGRGQQIRALYERVTTPKSAPIILFYGESGVGKSSLLAAGLLPRLQDYTIRYVRRDQNVGLIGALAEALWQDGPVDKPAPANPDAETLAKRWHEVEEAQAQPLIIILDQVEELFTRPNRDQPDELNDFLATLMPLFAARNQRPQGKLVLGFRKEWLADIEDAMKSHRLPRTKLFLSRLTRQGIMEAIEGVTRSERLGEHYRLTIEDGLAQIIADDLLEDPDSPVAPTLQILLTKMWRQAQAVDDYNPRFDIGLYQSLKREGLLLRDFLQQQLQKLYEWQAELVDSGLVIDLLAAHTTPQGTVAHHTADALLTMYRHRQEVIPPLVQKCEDLYLLFSPATKQRDQPKSSRLAHDALAPLVRVQYDASDRPGQRVRRILNSRLIGWRDDTEQSMQGNLLDERDLRLVEAGLLGTRNLTEIEQKLLEASRVAQAERERERAQNEAALRSATSRQLTAQSDIALNQHHNLELAKLLAIEAVRVADTIETNAVLRRFLAMRGRVVNTFEIPLEPFSVIWDEDNLQLLVWDGGYKISIWDINTGQQTIIFEDETDEYEGNPIRGVRWRPAQHQLLMWRSDKMLELWDVAERRLMATMHGHTGVVEGALWNQDGSRILSWCVWEDNTVRLWDAADGREVAVLEGHAATVNGAMWNQDESQILTWSDDGTARIWDAGECDVLTINADGSGVEYAAWNADETDVVTLDSDGFAKIWAISTRNNTLMQVWDAVDRDELLPFTSEIDIDRIVLNPENSHLLTISKQKIINIWDSKYEDPIISLNKDDQPIYDAFWDKEGNRILTIGKDGTIRLWNGYEGQEILVLGGAEHGIVGIAQAMWNADDTQILTLRVDDPEAYWEQNGYTNKVDAGSTVHVWDASDGTLLATLNNDVAIENVIWSKDGRSIMTLDKNKIVRQWDVTNTSEVATLAGHTLSVDGARWNANESRILTWGYDAARLWHGADGRKIATLAAHAESTSGALWNLDESRILTWGGDGTAMLWNGVDGSAIEHLVVHSEWIGGSMWNADESRILTWSGDGTAWLHDADGREIATLVGHTDTIHGATWNADGSRILTWSSDGTARLWDGQEEHETATSGWVHSFVRKIGSVTTGESGTSRRPLATLKGHTDRVDGALWNASESRILTWSSDNTARLWNGVDGREVATLGGYTGFIEGALWNADGSCILTWSNDGTARLWDGVDGRGLAVLQRHTDSVDGARWNADESRILTWSRDETARLWNGGDGSEIATLAGHTGAIGGVRLNADESRILTWSNDGTARIWDGVDGREIAILEGHTEFIEGALWNADESRILTWGYDHTVRLWDGSDGRELAILDGHTDYIRGAVWNADGSRVLSWGDDGTARLHFTSTDEMVTEACQRVLCNMTRDEWARYMPANQPYRATCEHLPLDED
ncbi:MAG: AAA family ATPase [Chloroflexota bacterium]